MESPVVPDYSGYLQRAHGSLGAMCETYYVEIYGGMLYFWKSRPQSAADVPTGSVDLSNTHVIDSAVNRLAWTVQGGRLKRPHCFIAASEQDKAAWVYQMTHYNPAHTIQLAAENHSSDDEERTLYTNVRREKVSLRDFEVTAVIGRGSFGRVYQVVKKGTGEVFAMKEMSKEVVERENLTEHIFAEKSILQTIHHPFIVNLHHAFQTKDRLYLVLDLLSGGELFFHLSDVGVFSEYRAKFYTAEIALAIGYLHSLNIIYRDLKPENVVLDSEGHVCLTDFGLAKTNVCDASASTFCGTPEYLAPEFLLGSPHGKAVDWWSLGTLFYEMLFGIPPFYSENVNAMYEAILSAPLQFRPDIDISDDAKNLLTRLLDRNPATRLQTIDELRSHPLFHDIDFDLLYQRKLAPPFRPDPNTLNNFDNEFTTQAPVVATGDEFAQEHANVAGFTYDSSNTYNNRMFYIDDPSPSANVAPTTSAASAAAATAAVEATTADQVGISGYGTCGASQRPPGCDPARPGVTQGGNASAHELGARCSAEATATTRPPLLQPTRVLVHREHRVSRLFTNDLDSASPSEQQTSSCASPVDERAAEVLSTFSRPGSGCDVYTRASSGNGGFYARRTQVSSSSPKEGMTAASPARSDATASPRSSPSDRPFSSRPRNGKNLTSQPRPSFPPEPASGSHGT